MQSAYERLREDAPDKVFILGGGCDADVPVIVYLSEKYQSDLTIIWLDAHGDLNTPGESASSLFMECLYALSWMINVSGF